LDSIVDSFGLSKGYKLLKTGKAPAKIENDKPDVDDGSEVDDAPDATKLEHKSIVKHGITASGGHCCHNHKTVEPKNMGVVEDVAKVVREQMLSQIERAIEGNGLSKDVNDPTDEDINKMVEDMLAILTVYMLVQGSIDYNAGIALLKSHGYATDAATQYAVSQATKASYQVYLMNVAKSYAEDTTNMIRRILAQGQAEGWSKETIAQGLRDIMDTDEWRVQRLARTEEHRSWGQASNDAMNQLMNETQTKIYKVWHTNGAGCEFCAAMQGKKELVSSSFLPTGAVVDGIDGGTFMNTFVNVDSANLHPNCQCYIQYEVEQ
jgi:hypothetical protein